MSSVPVEEVPLDSFEFFFFFHGNESEPYPSRVPLATHPKLHLEVLNGAYCLHISCSGVDCLMGDQMNEVRVQKSFENAVILLTLHLIFTQKKKDNSKF